MRRYTCKVTTWLEARHYKLLEERGRASGKTANNSARDIIEGQLDRHDDALLDGLNLLAKSVIELGEKLDQVSESQAELSSEMVKLQISIRTDLEKVAKAILQTKG
jgi:hypothetical protein